MPESKEPEKWYDREVNLTLGNLAKLSVSTFLQNPYGALSSFVDIVNHSPTSELIWSLVKEALAQSIKTVLKESRGSLTEAPDADKFDGDIKNKLKDSPVRLEPDFFANPRKMAVLHKVKEAFVVFLQRHGLNQNEAETMAARLDSTFVKALHSEYAKKTDRYSRLKDILNSPFFDASLDEQRWELYRERLIAEADEAVFGDVFSLQQIYIPLRAYHRDSEEEQEGTSPSFIVGDLENRVERWLSDGTSTVCMISGGPGSGKSSFTKMLAKQQAEQEQNRQILRIPLHEINLDTSSYFQSLGKHAQEKVGLSHNPLESVNGNQPLLLILDGLDELTKQGETTSNLAGELLDSVELEAKNKNRNAGKAVLKILVSGRPIVTQSRKGRWTSKNPLELYLLPYHLSHAGLFRLLSENYRTVTMEGVGFSSDINSEYDQRKDWWKKFAGFKNLDFAKISQRLSKFDKGSIAEITGQPLLNYLVARLYPELDIDPSINLNSLYEALIGDVYERDWDPEGNVRHIPGTFDKKQFLKALETVALAAWHSGDTRTATYEVVETCGKNFKRPIKLEAFRIGAEEGFARLLTAFYFRKTNVQEGKERFEFTHKSFGDYLVARVLVDEFLYISRKLANEDDRDGWRLSEALVYWARLCGPNIMSATILDFLRQEIHLRSNKGTISADDLALWQEHAAKLLSETIHNSMPVHKLELSSFAEMSSYARNAEESLLAMHSAIASVTRQKGDILGYAKKETDRETFKKWLMQLQSQGGNQSTLVLECLNDLLLAGCDLNGVNLSTGYFLIGYRSTDHSAARLTRVDLSGAYLRRANLFDANLRDANLSGAHLQGVNLSGTDLCGATLNGAKLNGTEHGDLQLFGHKDAIAVWPEGANLSGADLREANLRGTDFYKADIFRTRFTRKKLKEANIDIADFEARGAIIED